VHVDAKTCSFDFFDDELGEDSTGHPSIVNVSQTPHLITEHVKWPSDEEIAFQFVADCECVFTISRSFD
jgi:hypothetical protein